MWKRSYKDVGVTENQLFADSVHHIVKGKAPRLPGHGGMEYHLEKNIFSSHGKNGEKTLDKEAELW